MAARFSFKYHFRNPYNSYVLATTYTRNRKSTALDWPSYKYARARSAGMRWGAAFTCYADEVVSKPEVLDPHARGPFVATIIEERADAYLDRAIEALASLGYFE